MFCNPQPFDGQLAKYTPPKPQEPEVTDPVLFKNAIDLVQTFGMMGHTVSIEFRHPRKNYTSRYAGKWVVETMGQKFVDSDFLNAIRGAFILLSRVHGFDPELAIANQPEEEAGTNEY